MAASTDALIEEYRHGFHDSEESYAFKSDKGLNREIVERISSMKNEPEWMRDFRLRAYDVFRSMARTTVEGTIISFFPRLTGNTHTGALA